MVILVLIIFSSFKKLTLQQFVMTEDKIMAEVEEKSMNLKYKGTFKGKCIVSK